MTQPPNEQPEPGRWAPPPPAYQPPPPHPPQPYQPTPYQPQPYQPQPNQPPAGYQPQPYPQQPYQPQPYEQDSTAFTPQPAPPPAKRRAPLIASLVAVVALVGGGAITYVALSDSSDSGAASPKEAVQKVVTDLENSDFVGVLDDLAPGERDALANPIREDVQQLKDLHVLNDKADPSNVAGITFRAHDLSYAAKPIVVNDHVQIVQLTGGTVDITGDTAKLPFSDQFRSAAHVRDKTSTQHLNIASGGPVRIATVKVDGRWYPSIFYTAADSAAGHRLPSRADSIPALGSASAEDAVRDELDALLAGDVRTALAHVSPSELGAVHDYGGMLLDQVPSWSDTNVKITQLDLTTSSLSGGATRVGLKKLSLRKDGDEITIAIDGSCASVTVKGETQKFCASDAAKLATGFLAFGETCSGGGFQSSDGSSGSSESCSGPKLSPAQKTALSDLFASFTKLGFATTQTDGKWYINPVRSTVDLYGTLLGGLKGNDLFALATLGR
jgi:hypothetical protein